MPKWTTQEEQKLKELVLAGEALETIAAIMRRSPEAILKKVKRLGLAAPKRRGESVRRNGDNKVTISATTTTLEPTPEPLKPAAELISIEETLKIMLSG